MSVRIPCSTFSRRAVRGRARAEARAARREQIEVHRAHAARQEAERAAERARLERWAANQRHLGWPSYDRAVYALAKGVPWERDDPQPANAKQYLADWWEVTRWPHTGLAPEDVREEIAAFEVQS